MEKEMVLPLAIILVLIFISFFLFIFHGYFTGMVILESGGDDFSLGIFQNTEYNNSDVVLSAGNVAGNYTSKIFDVGSDAGAIWNSLSYVSNLPSVKFILGIDSAGDVYSSVDTVTWTQKVDNYGRTTDTAWMFSSGQALYILTGTNKEVWKSLDYGTTWNVVSDSFTTSALKVGIADSSGNLYVIDAPGTVWKSEDSGTSFSSVGDFNGAATNNALGIAINSTGAIFAVDGAGNVYLSVDSGATWTQQVDGYGGTTGTDGLVVDSENNLYILLNSDVYKSSDSGVTWSKINDDFSPYANDGLIIGISSDIIYIYDGIGRTFTSSNSGVDFTEQGDFNSDAGNDPKGIAFIIRQTNLTFQIRNCSLSDCSDGTWMAGNLDDLNLQGGRYFQYKTEFTSPDASRTPSLKSVDIDYDLLNSAPVLTLVSPQDGATYGTNIGLDLEYSAIDADDNLESCWYNLDNEENIILEGCTNITFDTTAGTHTLNLFVNDSLGEEVTRSAIFEINIGAPSIVLNSPVNGTYTNNKDITFIYTPTDTDLDSCGLWGDFTGVFELNRTDTNPTSGSENTFTLNLEDRTYRWNIKCNDTAGHSAVNGNKTFFVDSVNPALVLTQPTGAKTSRTITTSWEVLDASPVTCKYNVYRGGNIEVANTSVTCSEGSAIFSVTIDADFALNFYVNDSAGNKNSSSSSFNVDTSVPSSPVSSGGSGGGSSRTIIKNETGTGDYNVSFSAISNIITEPGESRKIVLNIKNNGIKFLNDCRLIGKGIYFDYLSSDDVKDLSPGEISDFVFVFEVPRTLSVGEHSIDLVLDCNEYSFPNNFKIEILSKKLAISLIDVEKDKNGIKIVYSLAELSGLNQEAEVEIALFNSINSERVGSVVENHSIMAEKEQEFVTYINNSDLSGNFNIVINVNSGISSSFFQEEIVLGNSRVGGLAILNQPDADRILSIVLVALFVIFAFFIFRRILILRRKHKKR